MMHKLKWFLSLLVVLASINHKSMAQSIKRQTIGSLGSSTQTTDLYLSQTVGQPYFTHTYAGNNFSISPGFQQSMSSLIKGEVLEESFATISVFPNPATNHATMVFSELVEQASIRIVDLSGQVVLHDVLTKSNQYHFDCSNWSKGIYFVSLLSPKDQQLYTSKIIISN